jgi:amidase
MTPLDGGATRMTQIINFSRCITHGLYSSYWNLLDYSSAVFPVGRLTPESLASLGAYPAHPPRNETERFISAQWDPETYMNAPISLQVIGRRLEEEKVLGVLNILTALALL